MILEQIEKEIDLLLTEYDSAMSNKNYTLSLDLINKIEKQLNKLTKNEIKIETTSLQ